MLGLSLNSVCKIICCPIWGASGFCRVSLVFCTKSGAEEGWLVTSPRPSRLRQHSWSWVRKCLVYVPFSILNVQETSSFIIARTQGTIATIVPYVTGVGSTAGGRAHGRLLPWRQRSRGTYGGLTVHSSLPSPVCSHSAIQRFLPTLPLLEFLSLARLHSAPNAASLGP